MKLADEAQFKRLLQLERRRSERAGSRFALVLVNLEELRSSLRVEALEDIGQSVRSMLRETDITGWYKSSSVLGLILTTLNGASRKTVETVMIERARQALTRQQGLANVQHIWISCYIFPEDETNMPDNRQEKVFFDSGSGDETRAPYANAMKRAIDIGGSLAALVALTPALLIISAVVKATSPGPVFYRQRRVGQGGREFTILKFRSMFENCDPAIHKAYIEKLINMELNGTAGTYKIVNDPRITRVGRILRKASLDELPQFFNVLSGEMSLVGPRPPIPYELEKYALWHRRRILEAKPGITGLWQVNGRSRTTFDEMVRLDLRYIRQQSLWLDMKILFKTPLAVIRGAGAY